MKKTILLFLTVLSCNLLFAQNLFFKSINEAAIQRTNGKKNIISDKLTTVSLNTQQMKNFLWSLPEEIAAKNSNISPIIELPMPGGGTSRFRVWESSVMADGLAKKYTGIKTFTGQGIDDPTATVRMDWTELGFHAMILSPVTGNIFIDPYQQLDKTNYTVYAAKDYTTSKSFVCETTDVINQNTIVTNAAGICVGTDLRTYRLALACTGEYAVAVCPPGNVTIPNTLSAMVTSVNRVSGVYEKDLSVRLVLIANNDQIIFLDGASDPYSNGSGTTMLGQNQTTVDTRIGTANYDIGHVFSTGGGGVAGLGVVCTNGQKARGVTGSSNPVGDGYDIDYVAHEMGHQFGGPHTFNAETGSCSGNRSGGSAVEPGSGITVMAYAGICGSSNDLAPHSIDIFHGRSLDNIGTYINSRSCQVSTATGNSIPVVDAGTDYFIPISTPFSLTGSATDANAADVLTYCWEQNDVGPAGNWNAPTGNAPLFRSFSPTTSPTRFFPKQSDVINNTTTIGEILPSYARDMVFRLTVRDNKAGGGGVCADETKITTVNGGGPFAITLPNGGESFPSGSTQTITWNVVGTNAAPISVANVRITLSTDGGLTYPTVIAASTANDGTETIALPCISTTTARIKVEAIGNIFYDISNTNFIIQAGFDLNNPATVVATCPVPATLTQTITSSAFCGFANNINFSATGNPAGTTVSFSPNPIVPGANTTISLNGANTLAPGSYIVTVFGNATGATTKSRDITFTIPAVTPPTVTTEPTAQTVCVGANATFSVVANNAANYQWQISTTAVPAFTNIPTATGTSYTVNAVTAAMTGNQYRVVVSNCATSVNSAAATLTVISPVVITTQPINAQLCSGSNTSFTVAATSSQTISYQWQVSTAAVPAFTNIPGATSATLSLNAVTATANGNQYRVLLSNTTCTTPVTSATATLTVRQLPTVGLSAAPLLDLLPGQTTVLTATPSAQTVGTLTTAWFKDGAAIVNTGNTRTVNIENTGTYRVTIQEVFTGGLVCANQSPDVVITAVVSNKLFIFPSPNNGQFTVSYYNNGGSSTTRSVTVYDNKGSRVSVKTFPVTGPYTLLSMDLRSAQKGLYFVVVGDAAGKKLAEGKVVIQ